MTVRWSGMLEGGVMGEGVTVGVLQSHHFLHQQPPLGLHTALSLQGLQQLKVKSSGEAVKNILRLALLWYTSEMFL